MDLVQQVISCLMYGNGSSKQVYVDSVVNGCMYACEYDRCTTVFDL